MSSGACRALVAVVLTLAATIVMTLPVAAQQSDDLRESAVVSYEVSPASGQIQVRILTTLQTGQAPWRPQPWGPIVIERAYSNLRESESVEVRPGGTDVPGPAAPWQQIKVDTGPIEGGRQRDLFEISYRLDASVGNEDYVIPARVDRSYVFLCVPGQHVDTQRTTITVRGQNWTFSQSGSPLQVEGSTLSGNERADPASAFTCIEGVREDNLQKATLIGPADREIELQAWADDAAWISSVERTANPALDRIWRFLGLDIPGQGPVIIREAPAPEAGGYAGAHDTPGVVSLSETGGTVDVEHQMAHAWFGKDNVQELWLREGLAEWIASSVTGEACAPVSGEAGGLSLSQWQLVVPTAPADYRDIIAAQEAAACGIVSAFAERMPEDAFRDQVLRSLLLGETKYNGSAGPEIGSATVIDYRVWLDAVDERGLVPAAKADPAFAANLTDLDFAQDLLDEYGIPNDPEALALRSEARARYHAFLEKAAPFGAPHTVRKHMEDWEFEEAMRRIEQSDEVYDKLVEANRLLPEADLMPIVQPQFENAGDAEELAAVTDWVDRLLEGATQLVGPLGELSDALPAGWTFPAVVNSALADQRFDDVTPAITPAIAAAGYISEASELLPQAGMLEKYQAPFEGAATVSALDQLTAEARSDSRIAGLASVALAQLENVVGDWTIPEAVTRPLEQGQLEAGRSIAEDASAVVVAAREGDLALEGIVDARLREETQPRFEAVTSAPEMAALRAEVEARSGNARALGGALIEIARIEPEWQLPPAVAEPISTGDYSTAVAPAVQAQRWLEEAAETNDWLPAINALERIRDRFESAQDLDTLTAGAEEAADWAQAAERVRVATDKVAEPRDMLTDFGLWGVDVETPLREATDAVIEADIPAALTKAAEVIRTIDDGASAGSLRLAGIVFFGVAVIGVAGLWLMLRRQHGPRWARSTKPHWIEDEKPRLLGRGKKNGKNKNDDKRGK